MHLDFQMPTKSVLRSLKKQRCRDGVMNDFLSWCRHLLVPFLFHDLTSLHPPSFHVEMIFPLVKIISNLPRYTRDSTHALILTTIIICR